MGNGILSIEECLSFIIACNASKGQKNLSIWLATKYCKERNITQDSVAPIIKKAIDSGQ
jgi:hypothetical protein